MVLVSVIVCTRNRRDALAVTMRSLIGQSFSSSQFEIIVVDNDSGDDTAQVVAKFSTLVSTPVIRYVKEIRIGSAAARNAGWEASSGVYVAYIDDDERASPEWLSTLMEGLKRNSAIAAAGPVELEWGKRPTWLPAGLERFYSPVNFGSHERILETNEYPLTANIIIERKVLSTLEGFRKDLGHFNSLPMGGEDIDLVKRIRSIEGKILYVPRALVYHCIPRERESRRWIVRRAYAGGLSMPLLDDPQSISFWVVLYDLRTAILYSIRACWALVRNRDQAFVDALAGAAIKFGKARQASKMLIMKLSSAHA